MKVINNSEKSYFIIQINIDNNDLDLINKIANMNESNKCSVDQYSVSMIELYVSLDTFPTTIQDTSKTYIQLPITTFNLIKTILIYKDIKTAILNMNSPNMDIQFISKLLVFSKGNYEVTEE